MNEYEIECTSRYEGTYTAEEIELNNQLYAECSKEILDCEAIEELLKKGADSLGATAVPDGDCWITFMEKFFAIRRIRRASTSLA